jgi:chromosome segregation ATPase
MSQPPDPERYLELFDYLDLDNMEDRRIGIHLLRNYFSTVLADIADKKLGAMTSINQESLEKQWRQVRRKFETVSGQMPEEIENLLNQIMEVRDPVTHNDRYDPRQSINDLQAIRELAPEWRDEVEELAEAYFYAWEDLSPKEALIDLAEQNLQRVLSSEPRFDNFDEEYTLTHEVAEEARRKLEQEVNPDRERIEKELVEVVRTVEGLRKKISDLEKNEMEYEDYLMNSRDQMMGR